LLGHVGIVREVLQNLVHIFGDSILVMYLTDTLFIRSDAQNIYSPKVTLRKSYSEACYYKKQILLILF